LEVSKSPYKERVAKTILELNSTNKAAQAILDIPNAK